MTRDTKLTGSQSHEIELKATEQDASSDKPIDDASRSLSAKPEDDAAKVMSSSDGATQNMQICPEDELVEGVDLQRPTPPIVPEWGALPSLELAPSARGLSDPMAMKHGKVHKVFWPRPERRADPQDVERSWERSALKFGSRRATPATFRTTKEIDSVVLNHVAAAASDRRSTAELVRARILAELERRGLTGGGRYGVGYPSLRTVRERLRTQRAVRSEGPWIRAEDLECLALLLGTRSVEFDLGQYHISHRPHDFLACRSGAPPTRSTLTLVFDRSSHAMIGGHYTSMPPKSNRASEIKRAR